jgi:hypothetical protein
LLKSKPKRRNLGNGKNHNGTSWNSVTACRAEGSEKQPHGNFKYRSCEGILNALKPLLAEAGAVVTMSDDIVEVGGRIYVKATATLICAGESISAVAYARESLSKKGLEDAQCSGMAK